VPYGGIFEVYGIGNFHEKDNGAYSTKQCLVGNVSNELLVTRSEIYVFVSCCQLTDDNGFLGRSMEGCISVDKKKKENRYCGHSTNQKSVFTIFYERKPFILLLPSYNYKTTRGVGGLPLIPLVFFPYGQLEPYSNSIIWVGSSF